MKNTQWRIYGKKDDFEGIGRALGISPITARLIRNRDVIGADGVKRYLFGGIKELHSPGLLPDMTKAVAVLGEKIRARRPVRIVGDYDIDGVCSTCILYRALSRLGARVDYEIPDRIKDGYGINEAIIRAAHEDRIDTILTCDNGIAAISQSQLAADLGITMVITDHHDIRRDDEGNECLPVGAAIVNPKRSDSVYPWPEICGGMVALKLVEALYEAFGLPPEEWTGLIQFAAIATVGDVMPLKDENRIVVKEGLKQIGKTANPGLNKLIEKNNLVPDRLSAYHIGFVIGPCLNAGGRLDSAKLALELLLTEAEERAGELADQLKELNETRKNMTKNSVEQAVSIVEQHHLNDWVLVVYLADCHESLAGIVAGRLRERYYKPAIVLTDAAAGVKGSGRSIEGYHMFEALVDAAGLLDKFGGHPMAAGLSLAKENIGALREKLNAFARQRLKPEDLVEKLWIDVALPINYVNEELIRELERLEPYGTGNPRPQFAQKNLTVKSARVAGKHKNVVMLQLMAADGTVMEARWFGDGDAFMAQKKDFAAMDVIYYPAVNEYNGNRSIQLNIKEYRFV